MSSTPENSTQLADKPYARLDYLLGKVPDPVLRSELDREVGKLRMNKKFGLVFEEHLPEHIRLYHLPVTVGAKVVLRDGRGDNVFAVEAVSKTKATIRHEIEGSTQEAALKDLVVIKKFGEPVFPSLVPVDRVERAKDKPWHTIINAENFHALQLLLYAYEGKVDVIYIDPPYNTGARDWKYNNNFVDSNDSFRHSKWLSMMKKRLVLAKRLLKQDGILVCAIDDYEKSRTELLLNEIFGTDNHLGTVVAEINPRGRTTNTFFATSHDYVLFYGNQLHSTIHDFELTEDQAAAFNLKDKISTYRLLPFRRSGGFSTPEERPNSYYPIYYRRKDGYIGIERKSDCMEIFPIDSAGKKRVWRQTRPSLLAAVSRGDIVIKQNGKKCTVLMKDRIKDGRKAKTVWVGSELDASSHGTVLLQKIFGERATFDFPKSLPFMQKILSIVTSKNSLILDYFAGSGTTLHATCLLNADDGGRRQSILVTNNEVEEKLARQLAEKAIYQGNKRYEELGICESVTWPRCKFVVNGKRDDKTILTGEYLNGRKLSDGFDENIQYFRLDYLDPNDIEYREKLNDVLPILWLTAGAAGSYEELEKDGRWFIAPKSSYAVLMQEEHFSAFQKELKKHTEITHVFLVTDAEESYRDMCAVLPVSVTTKMLYRSYLQNFRINIPRDL